MNRNLDMLKVMAAGCISINILLMLGLILSVKTESSRRWWVRPINKTRDRDGYFVGVYNVMKYTDHELFFEFTRLTVPQFDIVLAAVHPYLLRRSRRKGLEPELCLAATLSYLAHGDSVKSKAWQFRIGRSTFYQVSDQTCKAIYTALQSTYLPVMNQKRWEDVANGYQERWQFLNCLGALDGKHIRIQAPSNSGSKYFNYKKYHSIVLMAACDALSRFTWVDVGQYGSVSDGGVWNYTSLCAALDANTIDLPRPKKLVGSNIIAPFSFVADAAFPLKKYIMKPYSMTNAGLPERVFNYRLSRARRTIESAFGILVTRWQILHTNIGRNPERVKSIIGALLCLHNLVMSNNDNLREDHNPRIEGESNAADAHELHDSEDAVQQRNELRDYFMSLPGETQAPWQYRIINNGFNVN